MELCSLTWFIGLSNFNLGVFDNLLWIVRHTFFTPLIKLCTRFNQWSNISKGDGIYEG